ncbi:hypothetical protein ScPMuIL_007888 [Solemya velum]
MPEEAAPPPARKEAAVLSDASINALARELGPEKLNCIVLPMLLNLPTTKIVRITVEDSEIGLKEADDTLKIETTRRCLLEWKAIRCNSKDKEKVKELERALREMGRPEVADVVVDKHSNNVEITSDALQ